MIVRSTSLFKLFATILLTGQTISVLSQTNLSPTRFEDSSIGKEATLTDWVIFFENNYPLLLMEWHSDSMGCHGSRYGYVHDKSLLVSILGIKKEYFLIFFGEPNFVDRNPPLNPKSEELHYFTSGFCGKNYYTPLERYLFIFSKQGRLKYTVWGIH